jgi:hypothetical protein
MLQKLPGTELQGKVKLLWYWTYPATKLIKTGIGVVSQESTSSAPHYKNEKKENLLQCLIPHCPHVDLPGGKFYNACIEFYIYFFAPV